MNFVKIFTKPRVVLLILCSYLGVWRLPSLFDTPWYLDENIYLSVGYGLTNGQLLYEDIWDNKPPLIYLVYALSYLLGGSQIIITRVIGMLLAWWSIIGVYKFITKVFNFSQNIGYLAAATMAFLLTHWWETYIFNGEVLYEPFILWGSYVLFGPILQKRQRLKLILTGGLFAIAAFTKIHAIIIITVLVLAWFVVQLVTTHCKSWKKNLIDSLCIIGIMLVPYLILFAVYTILGKFDILMYSLYGFGKNYVSYDSSVLFGYELKRFSGNEYRSILLGSSLVWSIYLYSKSLIKTQTFVSIAWFLTAAYTVFLSQRVYPHYLISAYIPFVLVVSIFAYNIKSIKIPFTQKITTALSFVLFIQVITLSFNQGNVIEHYGGYKEYLKKGKLIQSGKLEKGDEYHRSFNPDQFTKLDLLTELIQKYSEEEDFIYVVANTPEIYPLTNRKSAYRHITDFQYNESIDETLDQIKTNNPSVIILDKESRAYQDFSANLGSEYLIREVKANRYEAWISVDN
jgi:4-amino-4-deoxy-L-arabinose transferase-like glycosyltransferase